MQKTGEASIISKKAAGRRIFLPLIKNYQLYLLVLAPLAVLILFKYIPIYGIQIAFRDFRITRGINSGDWVGFRHFQRFFSNPMAFTYIFNTLALSLYELCTFPLSLILALLIHYIPSKHFRKTVQMVSYAPYFISVVVLCGMILQFLKARNGLINLLLGFFGIASRNWITFPEAFGHIYVWSGVWQGLGYSSIIYIAALAGVSPELHEAAIIDGASIVKRIWHVDIPCVLPTFCILLILRCGNIMNVGFQKVLLLQNSLNLSASEIISTYTYNIGLNSTGGMPQYSLGAAVGLFTSVVNLVLLVSVNQIIKKLSGRGLF